MKKSILTALATLLAFSPTAFSKVGKSDQAAEPFEVNKAQSNVDVVSSESLSTMRAGVDAKSIPADASTSSPWFTPLILSEAATKEILNGGLTSLIAIGADGNPVVYLPYGSEINSQLHADNEVQEVLNISVRMPHAVAQVMGQKSYKICYPLNGGTPRPCPC